jgi:hypothetical protein
LSGNELTVDIKNRNTASAATRFRLGMPSLNLGLRLRKKRFWNSFRRRPVTGDRTFDNQVVVDGRNSFAVQQFLTAERRTVIQSFLGSFKGAVVTDDTISLTTSGQVRKSHEMLGAIDAMLQVANVLAEEPHSAYASQSESAAAAAIAATDTAEAVAPEPEPKPELAHADQPEPELAHADEPEAERTDAAADASDQPTEPDVEATTPSDSLTPHEKTPGIEVFCATVFAPGALSFAANQKFKESYAGKRIVWTGTLESMTPFTFDFDFGSGRGIKAVLTLRQCEDGGSRSVQAVIGLPPGSEGLYTRIGQPVSFTGRLLKVDGLAKRVLIADADMLQPSV